MMFLAKKLISAWVISPAGLGLLCLLGLWLCARGHKQKGKGLIAFTSVAIVLLSLPAISQALLRVVELPAVSVERLRDAEAIVIVGGGVHRGAAEFGRSDTLSSATLVRVRYGAWLAKRTGLPILVSGGSVYGNTAEAELMASALKDEFGIPAKWVEAQSKDTRENADMAAAILRPAGVTKVAVVTQAFHAKRASCLFRNAGLVAFMAPTAETALSVNRFETWLPSGGSVQDSFIAFREIVGNLLCR